MHQFTDYRQAAAHLRAIAARKDAVTQRAVARGALTIERHVKVQLSRSSHPRGTRTPSAPGSPPSLITGTLRRSTRASQATRVPGGWGARVGPSAVYGRIQEQGGVAGRGHRSVLPARPYVAPGIRTAMPEVRAEFARAWATE